MYGNRKRVTTAHALNKDPSTAVTVEHRERGQAPGDALAHISLELTISVVDCSANSTIPRTGGIVRLKHASGVERHEAPFVVYGASSQLKMEYEIEGPTE